MADHCLSTTATTTATRGTHRLLWDRTCVAT